MVQTSILEKGKTIKLECPEAAGLHQVPTPLPWRR
jgi:hypothetical protein